MAERDHVTRSEDEPQDRLTELANVLIEALRAQPDTDDVQLIVMLNDAEKGGIAIDGYEDEVAAAADLFVHLQAMFRASGRELTFAGFDGKGIGHG